MDLPPSHVWFIGRGGQHTGPFRWQDLQAWAADGTLNPGDLLWCDGMADWSPAVSVPGLFGTNAPPLTMPLDYTRPMLEYEPPLAVPYASVPRRLVAILIDGFIVRIAATAVSFVVPFVANPIQAGGRFNDVVDVATALLIFVAQWLYEALMICSKRQATVGKLAMGIIVVGPNGQRLSFGRSTGRYFGKYLSGLILGIGYLMAIWTKQTQTLHDLLARTIVLRKKADEAA